MVADHRAASSPRNAYILVVLIVATLTAGLVGFPLYMLTKDDGHNKYAASSELRPSQKAPSKVRADADDLAKSPASRSERPQQELPAKQYKVTVPWRNVRTIPTTADNKPLKHLSTGNVVSVVAAVKGQDPYRDGRTTWYQLADKTFIWAPGVELLKAPAKSKPNPASAGTKMKPVAKITPIKPQTSTPKTTRGARYVRPVAGRLTSDYGPRTSQRLPNGNYSSSNHRGIDLAAPRGTPIYAVAGGRVISSGWAGGAGRWVRIRHPDGTITMYAHTSRSYVEVGQAVPAGYRIAAVGSTGNSTGPHLHFAVMRGGPNGRYIDPLPWLAARGIRYEINRTGP